MSTMVERIEKYIASSIRLYPCNSNRASAIGGSCERQLVYMRVAWDKAIAPDVHLQMVFNEGDLQEKAVTRLLIDSGFDIYEQQASFFDQKANLTGHLDVVIVDPKGEINEGKPFAADIKSMSPYVWDSIIDQSSFQNYPWLKKYPAQIQCYGFFKSFPNNCLICKNKSTGALKVVWFALDLNYMDELLKKCDRINTVVSKWHNTLEANREALLPERITDIDECKMCNFRLLCRPEIDFGAPLKIEDNPEAEKMIERHESLSESATEYNSLHKKLTDMLKTSAKAQGLDTYNAMFGDWLVNGKTDRTGNKWSFVFTKAEGGKQDAKQ